MSDPPSTAKPYLDLNSATTSELTLLPGIGPVLAGRIVEWRERHEGFSTIAELQEVDGIGAQKLAAIQDHVYVESDSGNR